MQKKSFWSRFILISLLLPLQLLAANDQMTQRPQELRFFDDPLDIDRKTPSFFHSPDKETATAQLDYARTLDKAGDANGAIDAYQDLIHEWHSTPYAAAAQRRITQLREAANEPYETLDECFYALKHFPGKIRIEELLKRALAQADYISANNINLLGLRRNGNKALRKNYESIIHFAPRWTRVPELLQRIAALYEDDQAYASAITIYDQIIVNWPHADCYQHVVALYCHAVLKLAQASSQDGGRLLHLQQLIQGAIQNNPNHPNLKQFQADQATIYALRQDLAYAQARFYDKKGYSPQAARLTYQALLRDFPDAPQAPQVRKRLAEIEASEKNVTH